jgi:hypothetical protein
MRRIALVTILVAAMAVALKLAGKLPSHRNLLAPHQPERELVESPVVNFSPNLPSDGDIARRFPEDRELVERMLDMYGNNARRIAQSEGVAGLRLLGELADAGVCLFEERPEEFRQLCTLLARDRAAGPLLATWGRYLDPHRTDQATTALLAAELSTLVPRARRIAAETPEALPFLLLEPRKVADVLERWGPAVLEPLAYVELSDDGSSLRRALAVFEQHGELALNATEELGPAGFLLVERYGVLLAELIPELGMRRALAVIASGADDLDELISTHSTRTIAQMLLHLQNRDLLADAAGVRFGLRLAMDFGEAGERALQTVGPRVADLVYARYASDRERHAAVQAIARAGLPAAAALETYAGSVEFRRIIDRDGAAGIEAVAASVTAEENRKFLAAKPDRTWGEAVALTALRLSADSADKQIRVIVRDGLDRAGQLASGEVEYYQLLPLYDLSHLSAVVVKGQKPTRGELVWAGIDTGLIAIDALSLLSLQPEGVAAGEAIRVGAKTAARATIRSTGRAVSEHAAESAAARIGRAMTGELAHAVAGGMERATMSAADQAAHLAGVELARGLSNRSGIRLARWYASARFGAETALHLVQPFRRGGKYVTVNAAQAGIGTLALCKMDEYLAGRAERNHRRTPPAGFSGEPCYGNGP